MSQSEAKVRGVRQSSFYAIAYDIPEDKRRNKVYKLLKGFGKWTEYSLFECFLTKKELLLLKSKLEKHLNAKSDRVRIYSLCENCLGKVETVGLPEPVEETVYLI